MLKCTCSKANGTNLISIISTEKYSRGRRGAPAKGVGWETAARVQIPPSPPRETQLNPMGTTEFFISYLNCFLY